jgi:hypothetical protein
MLLKSATIFAAISVIWGLRAGQYQAVSGQRTFEKPYTLQRLYSQANSYNNLEEEEEQRQNDKFLYKHPDVSTF